MPTPELAALHLRHGTENLLDSIYCARLARGFSTSDLVGLGRDDSDSVCRMVGRLPERMVLIFRNFQEVWVIVKLPLVEVQPLPPVSDQVPVIEPPESVVLLAVPVTVPFSVRVLPPDCTV